jgi:recombination protein RecR
MNFLPDSITNLISELSKLPGIGPKSAQRLAFQLLKKGESETMALGDAILNIKKGVERCTTCFCLTSENPCRICNSSMRDRSQLCIVESTLDLIAIENTGEFKGVYHILQGRLSPLDGIGPDDLRMTELYMRITEEGSEIQEIILALNPDLEGDTTSLFLQKKLSVLRPLEMTRIARGIPSGGHLEYTDDATLIRALQGRQSLS